MTKNASINVGVLGIGSYTPEKVLNNQVLEQMVDTTDEWIVKRTGISERRVLPEDVPAWEMAVKASKKAIKNSGIHPEEIDMIIVATSTPDYLTPTMSCIVQRETGAKNAAAFDFSAACTGFIYGMTIAQQFIENGYYQHILLISCEAMSKVVDWTDRNTCVLFGDGAGAVILGRVKSDYGLVSTYIRSDGELGNNITIPCLHISEEDLERRKNYINKKAVWQDGSEIFKFAVRIMTDSVKKIIEKTGIEVLNIKYIVPHQANIRIIEGAAKRLGISMDQVYTTIAEYGNISSASIPVALADAYEKGSLKEGDYILLVGFGGGLTWGASLLKWGGKITEEVH